MNYIIYTITSPSNKIYLGVTNNFNRRMSEHKYHWKKNTQNIALHKSFTKYGFDSHIKTILFSNLGKEEAYELEKNLINDMNLLDSKIGLNSRDGGMGGNMIDWKSEFGKSCLDKIRNVKKIKYDQKWDKLHDNIISMIDTHTYYEICEELKISKTSLFNYCKSKNLKIKYKKKYNPIDVIKEFEDLLKDGKTYKEALKITGLSNGTVYRYRKLIN